MGGWLLALVLALPPSPALEGTVRGPDGKPVEKALVAVQPSSAEFFGAPLTTRSDLSGRFRLSLTSAGLHTVRVEARGLAARTIEKARPGAPLNVSLQKGGVVEGTVRDAATGQPVARARVEARDESALSLPWESEAGFVRTETDDKGRYRLEGIGPGLQTLTATTKSQGRARKAGLTAGRTVDFYVLAGGGIRGTIFGPDRKPVQGVLVRAEGGGSWRAMGPPEPTSAAGRFEILGLEPGTYRLVARHSRFAPAVVGGIAVERGADSSVDVSLEAGVPILGRILGQDDRPVAGRVSLTVINDEPTPPTLVDLLRAQSGSDGRFRLEGVPPGDHTLGVIVSGYAHKRVEISIGRSDAQVDLGDIALETGLTIRGRVRDKAGKAVAEAQLSAYPSRSGGSVEGRTESDGSFALGGLVPGSHRLNVTASGFGETERTVEAGSENVEVVLQPAGAVTGLVVDEGGRPVEAYRVFAQPVEPAQSMISPVAAFKEVASPDGRFVLEDVAEGTYVLKVTAPERAGATVSGVTVMAGSTSDVGRIRLTAGGTVRGIVVDGGGSPVAGATVTVRGAGRDTFVSLGMEPQAFSEGGGNFEVKGAPAGTVDVVASHPDFAEGRATGIEVDLAKGPAEVRVVLPRGGRGEGWVRKREGAGVPGTMVRLSILAPGGGMRFGSAPPARTRDDGSFVFERVSAGRARLMVTTETQGRQMAYQSKEIDVREGETSTVDFIQRDILVSGRVTRSGTPAAGLRVMLHGQSGGTGYGPPSGATPASGPERMSGVTREDGSYELLVDEPGRFSVDVGTPDGRLNLPARYADIPDAEAYTLNLSFAGVPLSGLVVDRETERPLVDVDIYAKAKKPDVLSVASASTGPDGRFQLELEPG